MIPAVRPRLPRPADRPRKAGWLHAAAVCVTLVAARSAGAASVDNFEAPADPFAQMIRMSPVGVVMPEVPLPNDLQMTAARSTSWRAGPHQHFVLLDGDTRVRIGSYHFRAARAVVRLDSADPVRSGVYDVHIYLDQITELGGYGPIRQSAPRLLVTARVEGRVLLETDRLTREPADTDELVQAAIGRFTRYEEAIASTTVSLESLPAAFDPDVTARRDQRRREVHQQRSGVPAEIVETIVAEQNRAIVKAPVVEPEVRITQGAAEPADDHPGFVMEGTVRFTAEEWILDLGDAEGTLTLIGNVRVMYHDAANRRGMTLSADNAVIFFESEGDTFDPDSSDGLPAGNVRGVYLEDNVIATDGEYTMRGPRVFYDFATDQAIVLDAVFHTWDVKQQVPMYVRAQSLRQLSRTQWTASDARMTTSEFREPHFSIGINKLAVTQHTDAEQVASYRYVAEDTTFNVGNTPVFAWPKLSGEATKPPLQAVELGYDSQNGAEIKTRWDVFSLLDKEPPDGLDASLHVDGYTDRGAGIGLETEYDVPSSFGMLDGYFLYDEGEDEPGGRDEVEPPTNYRGKAVWRHRQILPDDWEVILELGWVSDPTFLEEFFSEDAYSDKPYETLAYFKKRADDSAFTFMTQYDLNDFLPQLSRLQGAGNIPQAPGSGYSVDKLPEVAYYRPGTPLLNNTLTWYSENRASVMRLRLPSHSPREAGFNVSESLALFGLMPTTQLDTAMEARGFDDDHHWRGDSRQEIQMPMKVGAIDVVPYAVGRVTAYDDEFSAYSSEGEDVRLWGAAGLKLHTAYSKTISDVDSRLWDLHRLRHIIEPSVHMMFAATNINQESLPVYDYDVESLAEGGMVKFGLRNTFQTKRGGPGRWRSVDWLRIDTDFVVHTGETEQESLIPRFVDHRPEWSLAGDHFYSEIAWQVSDSFAMLGNVNYSFETSTPEQVNYGVQMDHSPRLRSTVQVRHIEAFNSTVMRYGIDYLLTSKYHLTLSQSYDFGHTESTDVSVKLTRRMPSWLLILSASYDGLGDISSVGVAIVPEGVGGGPARPERNPFITPELGIH